MRKFALLFALWTLACSGLTSSDTPSEPDAPCCSVDDVIRLTNEGVDAALIVSILRAADNPVELSAEDLVRLSAAEVDPAVIRALTGAPEDGDDTATEEPEAEPAKVSRPPPPPINVTVNYSGGSSFQLINLSSKTYTNLVLVANDSYQYRLKRLPAGATDNVRMVSFVSRKDGTKLRGDALRSLSIQSDQGQWSKRF